MSKSPLPIVMAKTAPTPEIMIVVNEIIDLLADNHERNGRDIECNAAEMFDVDIQIITGMLALVICRCHNDATRNDLAEKIGATLPTSVEMTAQLLAAKRMARSH